MKRGCFKHVALMCPSRQGHGEHLKSLKHINKIATYFLYFSTSILNEFLFSKIVIYNFNPWSKEHSPIFDNSNAAGGFK